MKAGFKKDKKVYPRTKRALRSAQKNRTYTRSGVGTYPSRKTFLSIVLGILLLVMIGFLINTNLRVNRRRMGLLSQIEILESEIKILEENKKEAEERVFQATSRGYLEEAARDQLGWHLTGEEVVAITEEKGGEVEEEKEEKSFWSPIKWWDLIRGR